MVSAQAPLQIPYQGVARDAQGLALQNQLITLRLTIEDVSGANLFQEIHQTTTNQFGLFNVKIGNVIPLNIDWSNGTKFLHVEMDPQGGGSYTDLGATQFLSVPYALYAETAANGGTVGPQGPAGPQGPIGPQGPAGPSGGLSNGNVLGEMLYWSGSAWVSIAPGQNGDNLVMCNGIPTWGNCISPPIISSVTISSVNGTSVVASSSITNNGGATIQSYGFCYATTPNVNIGNNVVYSSDGISSFGELLVNLAVGSTYYIKAFAVTDIGVFYSNENNFNAQYTTNYTFGTTGPAGGLIVYDQGSYINGWRYIEAAPFDATGSAWGCNGTNLPGSELIGLGEGLQNSIDETAVCGDASFAAKTAMNFSIGNFGDWYLPSKNEVGLLFALKQQGLGSLNALYYWSSSEASASTAWLQRFSDGVYLTDGKYLSYSIRPVRRF